MDKTTISNLNSTVVLLWRNLGPYHVARSRAAADVLKSKGLDLVVIELCWEEETRDWHTDRHDISFEILTLAPGKSLQPNTPSMGGLVYGQLQRIKPCAVAVAGYDRPEMRKAMKWCKEHGAASILMSETKWDDRSRPWWKRTIIRHWLRSADVALVSGAAAGEYMVSLGIPRERIFRHYGAVDNEYFISKTRDLKENGRGNTENPPDRYFLSCCRLIDKRKNISRLLSAYQAYRAKAGGSKWRMVICGDGRDREMLEQFVNGQNIQGILFAGFQQLEKLAHFYAHADCFIHPAINEAWGLVVNEAMASGLPVLVSRRCGCAYDLISEGENGFSFDPYNVNELAELMVNMTLIPDSRRREMGQASQRLIQNWGTDRFAWGLWNAIKVTSQ